MDTMPMVIIKMGLINMDLAKMVITEKLIVTDKHGDKHGYNSNGYDMYGLDIHGFDRQGYDIDAFNREGYYII